LPASSSDENKILIPPAMKAFLAILLAVGVFGEETDEVSDALVEEGINQLTAEISEDELKTLGQSGTLDFSKAFRCGLFMTWPGKSEDKPVSPLFIFNATFEASEECEAGTPNYKRYKNFCSSAWDKGFADRGLTLESPSIDKKRAKEGERVVDDICGYMKKHVKTPFVGRHSRKFPNGLEFGMFTNACGEAGWSWSGRTHSERVCCRKGRGAKCPKDIL